MTDAELSLWRAREERRDEAAFERLVRPHLRFLSDFATPTIAYGRGSRGIAADSRRKRPARGNGSG